MKLLFDEDLGRGVPEAMRLVGAADAVNYIRRAFRQRIRRGEFPDGVKDEDWIPFAGRGNWLVVSCNTGMLEAETQRQLLIDEGVGIVFLTSGQEDNLRVLKLLLRKLDWLETVDRQPRPFAYLMPISGRNIRRDPRVT